MKPSKQIILLISFLVTATAPAFSQEALHPPKKRQVNYLRRKASSEGHQIYASAIPVTKAV
ncbi:MAG: hypothetical protein JO275_03450 [Verrucomicrobia bacterium]|nr:hypothetical protein [Verrucomicrobiota bacterium]